MPRAKAKKIDCGGPRATFCRERQFPPSRCRGGFRTKTLSVKKGVKGVFCRVGGKLKLQTILRPKRHPTCKSACATRR